MYLEEVDVEFGENTRLGKEPGPAKVQETLRSLQFCSKLSRRREIVDTSL
jgi:hypothetical protein